MPIMENRFTTSKSLNDSQRAIVCSVCRERKPFATVDDNHNPVCDDCLPESRKGIAGRRID